MNRPQPISPIAGVPAQLVQALNNRFRMLQQGAADAAPQQSPAAVPPAPGAIKFTPALFSYGFCSVNNVTTGAGVVDAIDWDLLVVDELTTDVYATVSGAVDGTSKTLALTVTPSTGRLTPTTTLDFAAGQWLLFNDPGNFEWCQLISLVALGGGSYTYNVVRSGAFGSALQTHPSGVTLFIGQMRNFPEGGNSTRFDLFCPAVCVAAVTGTPILGGLFGSAVVVNCATATVPGIRTLIGGDFSFQQAGTLAAASGVNAGISYQVPYQMPLRVDAAYVGTAPTGASIKVNVRRSNDGGVTWTLIEQVVIATSATISWVSTSPPGGQQVPYSGAWPFAVFAPGDLLNYSIEQVGSTVPGANLTVKVEV